MSYAEHRANKIKKESELATATPSATKTYAQYRQEKDIASLGDDTEALNKALSAMMNGWTDEATLSKNESDLTNMLSRLASAKAYGEKNGYAKEYLDNLDEISETYSGIMDNFGNYKKTYSKYRDENDYNEAIKAFEASQKSYEEQKNADLTALSEELAGLNTRYDELTAKQTAYNRAKTVAGRSQGLGGRNTATPLTKGEQYEMDALKKAIAEKTAYYNRANYVQTSERLSAVKKNADFAAGSVAGSSVQNPGYSEAVGAFGNGADIPNKVRFLRDNRVEILRASISGGSPTTAMRGLGDFRDGKWATYITEMTDEEVQTYDYYIGIGRTDLADEYLKSIEETLASRIAEKEFEGLEDKTTLELLFGISAGLNQFTQGVSNNFKSGEGYIPQNPTQIASGLVRQDLNTVGAALPKALGGASLAQGAYDAITTSSNMFPSILASTVINMALPGAGSFVGAGLMGLGAAGNAYQEMINLGYTDSQARIYSVITGASETLLQELIGGIPGLGGVLTNTKLSEFAKGLNNAAARIAVRVAGNAYAEGMEEFLQDVLDPFFKAFATGENPEAVNWEEAIYSGLLGALSSIGLGAVDVVRDEMSASRTAGIYTAEDVQELIFNGLDADENSSLRNIAEKAKKKTESGKTLTPDEIRDLEQGNIEKVVSAAKEENLRRIAEERAKKESTKTTTEETAPTETEKTSDYKVSATQGKTFVRSKDGKVAETEIDGVSSVKNGAVMLKLKDGTVVNATSIDFPSQDIAEVVTGLRNLGVTNEQADRIFKAYDGKISGIAYMLGVGSGIRYGKINQPTRISERENAYYARLSESQKTLAESVGRELTSARTEKKQTRVDEAKAKANGTTVIRYGKVDTSKVDINRLNNNMRKGVSAQIRGISLIAEAVGVDVELFDSAVENKNSNGYYDGKKIHIDIRSGDNYNGLMMYTLGHEITHFIAKWSPEKFKVLADFLSERYGEKGESVNELVQKQIAKANLNNKTISEEQAYEEVIADSCTEMLLDESVYNALAELRAKDKTLFEKLKSVVKNILAKIKSWLDGTPPDAEEAKLVREKLSEFHDQLQNLFNDALIDAAVANSAIDRTLSAEEKQELKDKNLAVTDGVIVAENLSEQMQGGKFAKPVDENDMFSFRTTGAWAKSMRERFGNTEEVNRYIAAVESFNGLTIANDAVREYAPMGSYAYTTAGPLRTSQEYVITFDMDTSCPRTFQFLAYRNALQRIAKRPLSYNESIQLLELMRAYGQNIPCSYCYVENKRVLLSASYKRYFEYRNKVLSEADPAIGRTLMYGYNANTDTLTSGAQKTYDKWMKDPAYNPSIEEVWQNANDARNVVFNYLDKKFANDQDIVLSKTVNEIKETFGVKGREAIAEIRRFVNEWIYDTKAEIPHKYITENNEDLNVIDSKALALHHDAHGYAQSVSSSKPVENYIPYTDQLKNIPDDVKKYVIGMGGIRKHSSNDFRIDYVQDYFLFFADLAAGGWTGHTYTKSADYVRIFGRTNDRINMSIAMTDGKDGSVKENELEGMAWKDARELRNAYEDAGVMAMVTSDAQLSFALNSEWIDMCIPFHASSLDKRVWYDLRQWFDYTSKQGERFYNSTEMKLALLQKALEDAGVKYSSEEMNKSLIEAAKKRGAGLDSETSTKIIEAEYKRLLALADSNGVAFNKRMTTEEIANEYNAVFNVKVLYGTKGRIKPHFLPGETIVDGVKIPGHNNDIERYKQLCKEYGVHPRFVGVAVTDANGNTINITDHPGYLKVIKETAITDRVQKPIEFNFDKYDEYLKASPMEYAMQRLEQEAKNGGYNNLSSDPMGIVNEFAKEYLGKDRPLNYLTDRAKNYRDTIAETQYKVDHPDDLPTYNDSVMNSYRSAEVSNLLSKKGKKYNALADKRDSGARLTLSEFNSFYQAHKLIRAKTRAEAMQIVESIKRDGFHSTKGGLNTTNVASANNDNSNVFLIGYRPKKGEVVLLVPDFWVHQKENYILDNYKPLPWEVVEVEYNSQPYYELYAKAYNDYFGIDSDDYVVNKFKGYSYEELMEKRHDLISKAIKSQKEEDWNDVNEISRHIERFFNRDGEAYSDRNPISNRQKLAESLKVVAETEADKNRVAKYLENVELITEQERILRETNAELKELSFAKGKRDTARINELKDLKTKTVNRIAIYDRRLVNIEVMEAVRSLIDKAKADVRAKDRAKYRESLAEQKNAYLGREQAIREKYRESRANAIEGRNRTALRHKLINTLNELDSFLKTNKGKKFVLPEMREAVADAMELINRDTYGAEERIKHYEELLAKETDPDEIAIITARIERMQKIGDNVSERIKALRDLYEGIKEKAGQGMPIEYYSPDVYEQLGDVARVVGNKSIRDLDLNELTLVNNAYSALLTVIKNANKAFLLEQNLTLEEHGKQTVWELNESAIGKGGKYGIIKKAVMKFDIANKKPIYYFRMLGSETLMACYKNLRTAMGEFYKTATDIAYFRADAIEKYNINDIDLKKKYPFYSWTNYKFELSVDEMMSIYALSKNEDSRRHLELGGFRRGDTLAYDEKTKKHYFPNETVPNRISEETIEMIVATLNKISPDLVKFVDEMQTYLSETMGEMGNKTYRVLRGYDKFTLKDYSPIITDKIYIAQMDAPVAEASLVNSGYTKDRIPSASAPIMLTPFMEEWTNHCVSMAQFATFVLPIEDLRRIYNYNNRFLLEDDGTVRLNNEQTDSIKGLIANYYTPAANDYMKQLLSDINGGITVPPGEDLLSFLVGRFRKSAVIASLSVAIQQPGSVGRAFAYINPKYFAEAGLIRPKNHKAEWEECKKYAPIAGIKEMGFFDVGVGRTVKQYITRKQYDTLKEKLIGAIYDKDIGGVLGVIDNQYRDEILGFLPQLMDEVTWTYIWRAVKKMVADTTDIEVGSRAFLEACGEKFTEVIDLTQVYDSVLSRSGLMRSNSAAIKAVTAFMAEPTTTANMLEDAVIQNIREGAKGIKNTAKIVASVLTSEIVTAALKAVIMAYRDDKDEEAYLKGYWKKFVSETLGNLNPLNLYPILRDVMSIIEGYHVDRSDTELIYDLVTAFKSITNSRKSTYQKVTAIISAIGNILGIPYGNLERDIRPAISRLYRLINGDDEEDEKKKK